jgi:drug/metabolite transporter (DMT)-like permease
LLSAASWGAGDFSGGLAAKRASVYSEVLASQSMGAVLLAGLALAFHDPFPPLAHMLLGGVAGVAGSIGLLALYRALASGRMGVAAPASAVVTAIVPVAVGALTEGLPDTITLSGFGLALIGVWFVSSHQAAVVHLRELGLPVVAGLGFGIFLVIIDRANDVSALWPLVGARVASLIMLWAFATLARQPRWPEREQLPLIALVGLFDAGGNAFYALAARAGRLDVAAVLSSLYPASTVLLAWSILKERISRLQAIGILTALAAIVLITA